MNNRRKFLRLASAAAIPAAAMVVSSGVARADDGSAKEFLGSWNTIATVSSTGSTFREFLSFADGGVLHETNSFLHTASNLDFSPFGFNKVANASDGVGNWERVANGVIKVVFRKMMFDAATRENFGDLHVTGTPQSDGTTLICNNWHVEIVDPLGKVLADFGTVTSRGIRLL